MRAACQLSFFRFEPPRRHEEGGLTATHRSATGGLLIRRSAGFACEMRRLIVAFARFDKVRRPAGSEKVRPRQTLTARPWTGTGAPPLALRGYGEPAPILCPSHRQAAARSRRGRPRLLRRDGRAGPQAVAFRLQ